LTFFAVSAFIEARPVGGDIMTRQERSVSRGLYVLVLGAVVSVACVDLTRAETFNWSVSEPSGAPSSGVEVCELDTDNCDTTDPVGFASVTVASDQEVAFTFRKEGYGSVVRADVSDTFGPGDRGSRAGVRMYPDQQLKAIAEQLGASYPWEGGVVGLNTGGAGRLAGITFAPAGATVDAVGESFYYDVQSEQYRLDLDATTGPEEAHLLPLHSGGFTEVARGVHEFDLGGPAGNCPRPSWAWPGGAPNRVRVPVLDGHVTYASMICDGAP